MDTLTHATDSASSSFLLAPTWAVTENFRWNLQNVKIRYRNGRSQYGFEKPEEFVDHANQILDEWEKYVDDLRNDVIRLRNMPQRKYADKEQIEYIKYRIQELISYPVIRPIDKPRDLEEAENRIAYRYYKDSPPEQPRSDEGKGKLFSREEAERRRHLFRTVVY
jgi:hypothetical protein